jgi:hypothetical protein
MYQARQSNAYDGADLTHHRQQWYAYYSQKRIVHQWFQLKLLEGLPVQKVLEVGPHLGVVSAMLTSAGYDLTTLDVEPQSKLSFAQKHITADVTNLNPQDLAGHDAILCCETLEHIVWDDVGSVLQTFAASKVPYLILSVPYNGLQFWLELYLNPFKASRSSAFKCKNLRPFRYKKTTDNAAWETHKWEAGYKNHPVAKVVEMVEANGWNVDRKDFTAGCRSLFLVCRNKNAA